MNGNSGEETRAGKADCRREESETAHTGRGIPSPNMVTRRSSMFERPPSAYHGGDNVGERS